VDRVQAQQGLALVIQVLLHVLVLHALECQLWLAKRASRHGNGTGHGQARNYAAQLTYRVVPDSVAVPT
jgi:hypothetical protein